MKLSKNLRKFFLIDELFMFLKKNEITPKNINFDLTFEERNFINQENEKKI